MTYYSYWGKWGGDPAKAHLLVYHSLDVAATFHAYLEVNARQAEALFQGLGERDATQRWLTWLVSLHDLGKFSPTFQGMVPEAMAQIGGVDHREGPVPARHDELGICAWEALGLLSEGLRDRLAPLVVASMGHHGYPVGDKAASLGPYRRSGQMFPGAVLEDMKAFALEMKTLLKVPEDWAGGERGAQKQLSFLMAGLVVLADWVGSNEVLFPRQTDAVPLGDYWERAQKRARKALVGVGVHRGQPKPLMRFEEQFTKLKHPTPLQVAVGEVALSKDEGPQVFILESLTGDGKTEAAMRLTHRLMAAGLADGFYLALPTMATSNAMYKRMSEVFMGFYENPAEVSLVLAHGAKHIHQGFRASLYDLHSDEARCWRKVGRDDEAPTAGVRCNAWVADNAKKALLAQCGVGTIDQAMLAVMVVKHQSLRLFGLHGKVLIVDEVHANDAYMHQILQRLLEFHAAGGGSAILLSATLPQKMRQELVDAFRRGLGQTTVEMKKLENVLDYPLLTQSGAGKTLELPVALAPGRARKVRVLRVGDPSEAMAILLAAAKEGKCACWVRNTVREATEAHAMVRLAIAGAGLEPEKAMLFHARFAMGDRLIVEGEVTRLFGESSTGALRAGRVLVATQVVEQSLDIDFDMMITDLAPIDLIVQRAGRLRRHRRNLNGDPLDGSATADERGEIVLHVLGPDPKADPIEQGWVRSFSGGTAVVYPDHAALWRGFTLLLDGGGFNLPQDARPLIEGVYGDIKTTAPVSLQASELQVAGEEMGERAFAFQNALLLAKGYSPGQAWAPDSVIPTRLGDASLTVRLACWDGQRLLPWGFTAPADPDYLAWAMSEIRVRATVLRVPEPPAGDAAREALALVLDGLPDHGEWTPVLVLTRGADGSWGARAAAGNGVVFPWRYNAQSGFERDA